MFKEPRLIDVQDIITASGKIGVIEASKHLGFQAKRLYFLHNIKEGSARGAHAHKELRQCVIAMHGSVVIELEGKGNK